MLTVAQPKYKQYGYMWGTDTSLTERSWMQFADDAVIIANNDKSTGAVEWKLFNMGMSTKTAEKLLSDKLCSHLQILTNTKLNPPTKLKVLKLSIYPLVS